LSTTIDLYLLQIFNANSFRNKRLKITLLLNKLVLQVAISKVYKTNIKILWIAILNKLRIQYFNVKTIELTKDIYISILYYLRLCYYFLALTKISLVNNLQLIEKKL